MHIMRLISSTENTLLGHLGDISLVICFIRMLDELKLLALVEPKPEPPED